MALKGAKVVEWEDMLKEQAMMIQIFKSSDMDMVSSIGQMVPIMKVNGSLTKQKDKELSGTRKVMCTAVSSRMIWLMDMASTLTSTDPNTKENSKMTYKRVMVRKSGLMGQSMLDLT